PDELGRDLRPALVPVVPDFVATVLSRTRAQTDGLHATSPRAIAISSSRSDFVSVVAAPLASPSSTIARNRAMRCSRWSLRIRSRTYSLVLPYSPDATRSAT